MLKTKIFIGVLIFIFVFSPLAPAVVAAEEYIVTVAEGNTDLPKVAGYFKTAAKEFCDILEIAVSQNNFRFEIDEDSGTVVGAGKATLNFTQKCPEEPIAKLIKNQGQISIEAVFSGVKTGNKITGTWNADLSVPTLISFNTKLSNLAWNATLSSGVLNGSMTLEVEQFEFSSNVYFKINTKKEKAKFLSASSKKLVKAKRDIATAMQEIAADHKTRENGVSKLDWILFNDLPLDKRPWAQTDPIPEIDALFSIFEGYLLCVQKNADEQASGNPQWEKCVARAARVIEKTQDYIRLVGVKESSSILYFTVAQMWNRLRYFTMFAPSNVRYNKVENCENAKTAARRALFLDSANQTAKDFLKSLGGKMGCDGTPLFGINREEIAKNKQAELARTQAELAAKREEKEKNKQAGEKILKNETSSEENKQKNSEDVIKNSAKNGQEVMDSSFNDLISYINKTLPPDKAAEAVQQAQAAKSKGSVQNGLKTAMSYLAAGAGQKIDWSGFKELINAESNILTAADTWNKIVKEGNANGYNASSFNNALGWQGWGALREGAGAADIGGAALNAVSAGFAAYDNVQQGASTQAAAVGAAMNVDAKIAIGALAPATALFDLLGAGLTYGGQAAGGMQTRSGAVMLGFANVAPGAIADKVINGSVTSDYDDLGGIVSEMYNEVGQSGTAWGTTTEVVNLVATTGYVGVVGAAKVVNDAVVGGIVNPISAALNWARGK